MNEMFFESQSKYSFDETLKKLEEIIGQGNWRVIHIHDLQETMRKNSSTVLPAKVIELCMPTIAHRLLSKDDLRIYSNMMPCRIALYEKEDGRTYVSRMNIAMLSEQLGGDVEEIMSDAFHEAEVFIKSVTD